MRSPEIQASIDRQQVELAKERFLERNSRFDESRDRSSFARAAMVPRDLKLCKRQSIRLGASV